MNAISDPVMTVYLDEQSEGIRTVVLRGPASVNAYLGVPVGHPLAGGSYDDLSLDVHGGLTFGGTFKEFPGWYFYGWDYAHAGDKMLHTREVIAIIGEDRDGRYWSPEDVISEARDAEYDFRKLVRLAERISSAAKAAKEEKA
jgi:hypothetical protein